MVIVAWSAPGATFWHPTGDIRVLELPLAVPELIEAAWWHPSRSTEPGQRWLQQLLQEAAASLGELRPPDP